MAPTASSALSTNAASAIGMSSAAGYFCRSSSGNRAFDEYKAETLRRLEDEQREFHDFLGRLRMARDKAEFDQFMNDRRNNPPANPPAQPDAA